MKKILYVAALLALLAVPFWAVAADNDRPPEPDPRGDPIACEEGQITVEESEWVCTWKDTSYEYQATYNEAETEWRCPDGFTPSRHFPEGDEPDEACVRQIAPYCPEGFTPTRNFPDGDEACVRVVWVDDERVVEYAWAIRVEYARAFEVEIAPAYLSCDAPSGELRGETCYVEQGEWDCGWTEPLCRTPDVVRIDVCHQAGPRSFVLVPVSIHSVNDANGLNGHGRHGRDAWNPFVFDGQQYAGQGDFPGDCGEEPTLRIAGTCSDEGVGQIVGLLNLGDQGVSLLIEGQGSRHVIEENGEFGPIPARPGNYTWTILGLGDNGRVIKDGEFTVDKCYQTCDETFREAQEPTYSDWSEWEWDSDRDLFVQTRIKSTVVLAIDARDEETVCARGVIEEEEERTRGPDEALVGVSLGCDGRPGKGTVYQLIFSVTVEPAGGATVFFNGNEYTEGTGGHIGFGSYDWSAEAAESFKIVGDDEGTVKLTRDDCNPTEPPPEHPPTGGEIDAGLAVVTGLMGFALAGIGGSILFMKRRASR